MSDFYWLNQPEKPSRPTRWWKIGLESSNDIGRDRKAVNMTHSSRLPRRNEFRFSNRTKIVVKFLVVSETFPRFEGVIFRWISRPTNLEFESRNFSKISFMSDNFLDVKFIAIASCDVERIDFWGVEVENPQVLHMESLYLRPGLKERIPIYFFSEFAMVPSTEWVVWLESQFHMQPTHESLWQTLWW